MAHHIYHTDSLVLEGRNIGEANRYFYLFTRQFGMIEASAQSVREVRSKLRASLRDLSFSTISLVRGKSGWKITNAIEKFNFFEKNRQNGISRSASKSILVVMSNISVLLRRLLNGEEKNERLFDLVFWAFYFMTSGSIALDSDVICTECLLVINILYLLGYVGQKEEFRSLLISTQDPGSSADLFWNKSLLAAAQPLRKKILSEINISLQESQL